MWDKNTKQTLFNVQNYRVRKWICVYEWNIGTHKNESSNGSIFMLFIWKYKFSFCQNPILILIQLFGSYLGTRQYSYWTVLVANIDFIHQKHSRYEYILTRQVVYAVTFWHAFLKFSVEAGPPYMRFSWPSSVPTGELRYSVLKTLSNNFLFNVQVSNNFETTDNINILTYLLQIMITVSIIQSVWQMGTNGMVTKITGTYLNFKPWGHLKFKCCVMELWRVEHLQR
jgi:hypothetical protein